MSQTIAKKNVKSKIPPPLAKNLLAVDEVDAYVVMRAALKRKRPVTRVVAKRELPGFRPGAVRKVKIYGAAKASPSWEVTGKVFNLSGMIFDDYSAARAIERGLPVSIAAALESVIGVEYRRQMVPDRTLARRVKSEQTLTVEESEKVLQTARIVTLAISVFGSQVKAQKWLSSPKKRFDGRAPLDLVVHTGPGAAAVEQMLGQIDEGLFG